MLSHPTPAPATVAVKRDFPDLVARAEQIVVGTVTAIREGENDSGQPATYVTFSDLSVLKGQVGAELTLRIAGGTIGQYAVRIADLPTFQLGERAVLFVAGNGRDVCPLVGVWQGRFRVRFDPDLDAEIVERDDGQTVVGVRQGEVQVASREGAGGGAATPLTLDAFRQLVADELAAPSSTPGN
jgi:hypothetical protein